MYNYSCTVCAKNCPRCRRNSRSANVHMGDVLQEDYYEISNINAVLEDHMWYECGYDGTESGEDILDVMFRC